MTPPFEHPRRPTQAWERRADGERGLLLGRLALRARVVPGRSVGEALALQDRLRAIGGSAPPLGQVLQDLGMITADQATSLVEAQRGGAIPTDDRVGGLAVLNGFTTAGRIEAAAARQAARVARGDPPQRLGEILVADGDLSPQAVRALLVCQARLRGAAAPLAGPTEALEVVPGGYRVGGEMLLLEDARELPDPEPAGGRWAFLALALAIVALVLALITAFR